MAKLKLNQTKLKVRRWLWKEFATWIRCSWKMVNIYSWPVVGFFFGIYIYSYLSCIDSKFDRIFWNCCEKKMPKLSSSEFPQEKKALDLTKSGCDVTSSSNPQPITHQGHGEKRRVTDVAMLSVFCVRYDLQNRCSVHPSLPLPPLSWNITKGVRNRNMSLKFTYPSSVYALWLHWKTYYQYYTEPQAA